MCGAPALREQLPFCSPRCRDRDLLQWLGDGYRVPGDASEDGMSSLDNTDARA